LNYGTTGLFPTLGDVFVTSAVGKSLYNGFTVGMRKRFTRHYQFEWNYVLAKAKIVDIERTVSERIRSFDHHPYLGQVRNSIQTDNVW